MNHSARQWSTLFIFFLSLTIMARNAKAQYGVSNARSVAMGGAYTALARGVEAPSWNPANLGLSGRRVPRLNLISIGVGIHNNSFSKSQYELYNGSYLTEKDKQDIMTSIPAEGLWFNLNTEVQAAGLSIGPLAFTASGHAASDFSLSKDIADLLLYGNDFERQYTIGDTNGEGWAVSSFAVSGGFRLFKLGPREVAVGVSAKVLRGFAYGKVVEASSQIYTDIDGVHSSGRIVIDRALGGSGLAFDLGAATNLNTKWTASLGVTNLINSVNWNNDTKRLTYTFRADSVSLQKLQDSDIDSVIVDSDEEVDIQPFSTNLPRQLRLGFARTTKRLSIAVDYIQVLSAGTAASTNPRLALGGEVRLIGFIPLRAGIAVGGNRGLSSSFGFALDFSIFSWDFAVSSQEGLFSGKGAAFAFDWMFRL